MPTFKIDLENFDRLVDTARRVLGGRPGDNARELAESFLVFATAADLPRVSRVVDKAEARRQAVERGMVRGLRSMREGG